MADKKRCREILSRICAEVGQPQTSKFCQQVARHLEECESCRAQAISLRGTLELYRCMEAEDVPPETVKKLREQLGLPDPQDRSSKS